MNNFFIIRSMTPQIFFGSTLGVFMKFSEKIFGIPQMKIVSNFLRPKENFQKKLSFKRKKMPYRYEIFIKYVKNEFCKCIWLSYFFIFICFRLFFLPKAKNGHFKLIFLFMNFMGCILYKYEIRNFDQICTWSYTIQRVRCTSNKAKKL